MKKKKYLIAQIILLLVLAFSSYKIFEYFQTAKKHDEKNEEIKALIEEEIESETESKTEKKTAQVKKVEKPKKDYDGEAKNRINKLKEKYPDIVAWIRINGTVIDYPIAQAEDNDYYLWRDLDGEWSKFGTVFLNSHNKPDFTDKNTVIFGHNIRIGRIFHELPKYLDKEFLKGREYIEIMSATGYHKYEIIACYKTMPDFDYIETDYKDWKGFLKSLEEVNALGLKFPQNTDKILTISTCDDDTYRLVIHAIPVADDAHK